MDSLKASVLMIESLLEAIDGDLDRFGVEVK